jgi:hypothetical protein
LDKKKNAYINRYAITLWVSISTIKNDYISFVYF